MFLLYNESGDTMKKIGVFLIFMLFLFSCIYIYDSYKNDIREEKINKIEDIKKYHNEYVITDNVSKIYELVDNVYNEIGTINSNVELKLSDIVIDENTKYFHVENLDYYIAYSDVKPIESLSEVSNHYKNYVVFNENIVTKEVTNFYNENGLVYTINQSFNLPIIIKDDDCYYVEIYDEFLYVKKEDVEKVVENSNTNVETRDDIRTFAYHFVYKPGDNCTNSYICHPEEQFISHMKYLNENDYFTLTMNDLKLFLEGKIRIPKKSTVITFDDGHLAKNAIEIMEQYQINGTYFVVSSWVNIDDLQSDYVELHSHTNNMHNAYKCPGGQQGGQILCENRDLIVADLKESREKLNGAIAFAYPFYDYNDYVISILKEVGFELAFIGADTTFGYANQNTDLLKIPRLTLSSQTTMDEFISYLK